MKITHEAPHFGSYTNVREDPLRYQREFHNLVFAEPGIRGRILDIGCSDRVAPPLTGIHLVCRQLDGIDPSPSVHEHRLLKERWQGKLEDCPLPRSAYDLAYAFNVVEHVERPREFLAAVLATLKPGGVFWALTPNGTHPFCPISRTVEKLGLKSRLARRGEYMNDYPAYYRLNTARRILRAARGQAIASARFVYLPCTHWEGYFPGALRWVPHLYDRALGSRWPRGMSVLAFRLQLPGPVPDTRPESATQDAEPLIATIVKRPARDTSHSPPAR